MNTVNCPVEDCGAVIERSARRDGLAVCPICSRTLRAEEDGWRVAAYADVSHLSDDERQALRRLRR
jgi:hypothetical protein